MSIQPLAPEVIAQIKSSITITSLNGVIFELVRNSLDAESTKIDISVDYARGGCVVEDNGLGILPSEFGENGGLGKMYHSSKLACQTPVHGKRGAFLASLSAMSLLSITSHHHSHRSHNTMSMHKYQVISRQIPASAQQYLPYFDHGTRVTVRDLFGSMPVRVKQRAIITEKQGWSSKDWDALKRDMVMLLLAWPPGVSVTLREIGANQRMFIRSPATDSPGAFDLDISKVCSILTQASFITTQERSSWVYVRASTTKLEINGGISLIPSPTKHVQFIALGIQPLISFDGSSIMYDEINRLFQNSAFGKEEVDEPGDAELSRRTTDGRYGGGGFTKKELKGARKGVDRWPMFYINIQQPNARKVDVDDILDDKGNSLGAIIELLQAMVLEFLTKNHFGPTRGRGLRTANKTMIDENLADLDPGQNSRKESPRDRASNKSNPSKGQMTNSDLLGGNVKLPSFRQASALGSPFDTWSRMKSGAPISKATVPKDTSVFPLSSNSPLHRPATAPLPPRSCSPIAPIRSSTPGSTHWINPLKPPLPLVSSTGKVTRRPFDEADTPHPKVRRAKSQQPPTLTIDNRLSDDDIVAWVNPITKMRSLVNQRTGHTVAAAGVGSTERSAATKNSCLPSHKPLKSKQANQVQSEWIGSLLRNWDNPIFRSTEAAIPQVSVGLEGEYQKVLHGHKHNCTQLDIDRAFREVSAGINGRISKDALRNAEVISQVDKKFILVKIPSSSTTDETRSDRGEGMLVIVDQHAADERIRIEHLLSELCTPPPSNTTESRIQSTSLEKPLTFDIPAREIDSLRKNKQHFSNWGILFSLPTPTIKNGIEHLTVYSLPPVIAERCTTNPRLLIDIIRTELHAPKLASSIPSTSALESWLTQIHTIPQGVLDMLNSRACRTAIMFNDELSKEQCEVLIGRLAQCMFPFQCAHGRPSLVPLVELGRMGFGGERSQGRDFGREFGRWKEKMGHG